MISTGGNGNAHVKYVEPNTIRVTAGGNTVVDHNPNGAVFSQDVTAPGGMHQRLKFFKGGVLQAQSTQMTASFIVSGAQATLAQSVAVTKEPMFRAGSVLGLMLYTENANFTAIGTIPFASGVLTASVTLDGVNTAATLVCEPSGTTFLGLFAKDLVAFSASQKIGVTLTSSVTYGSDHLNLSASWTALVLIEA